MPTEKRKEKMEKLFVLDTSAILNMFPLQLEPGTQQDIQYITSHKVLDEVMEGRERTYIEATIEQGQLEIHSPSKKSIEKIKMAARRTGDLEKLSEADIDVLALALGFKSESKKNVDIITDDYAIQNVADYLGIKVQPIAFPKIRKQIRWKKKCPNCGKKYKLEEYECPICCTDLIRCK